MTLGPTTTNHSDLNEALQQFAVESARSFEEVHAAGEQCLESLRAIGPTLSELVEQLRGLQSDRSTKLPRKTRKALEKAAVGWSLTRGDARRIHRAFIREWL